LIAVADTAAATVTGTIDPSMNPLTEARKLVGNLLGLLGKKSELDDPDLEDVMMAQVIRRLDRVRRMNGLLTGEIENG
jgi:hypothetical protein